MTKNLEQDKAPTMGTATEAQPGERERLPAEREALPSEKPPASTRRRVAFIAGGSLLFVVLLNVFCIWYLRDNTPNTGYLRIRTKWQMLQRLQKPVDTLILGDSSGAQGIDPEILSGALGGSAINLCTVADMTVVNGAVMLDEYLKKHPAPKRVVLIHVYDIWERPMTGYAMAQMPFSSAEAQSAMPWYPISSGQRIEWLTGQYFPLYSESQSIVKAARQAVLGGGKSANARRGIREDGFSRTDNPDPKQVESDVPNHLAATTGTAFRMNEENRKALQRMAQLADEKGFELVLVNSPILGELYDDNGFRDYYRSVVAELEKTLAPYKNARYLFKVPMTFDKGDMTNVDHLTYSSAQLFTERLAGEIIEGKTAG